MRRPKHNTTSLPRHLRAELGIRDTYGDKKRRQNGPAARKDRRRAERTEKKSKKNPAPARRTGQRYERNDEGEDEMDVDLDEGMSSDDAQYETKNKSKAAPEPASKPKSILKKSQKAQDSESDDDEDDHIQNFDEDEEDDLDDSEDEDDDADSRPHVPANFKSKLAEDDAEIAALEKKLGLKKGKKLPKAFAEDGLEDLLGDLGEASEDDSRKRKREADEWLREKRLKAQKLQKRDKEEDDSDMDSDEDADALDEQVFGSEDDEESIEGSDFDGFDEEEKTPPKKRENPYVAPISKPESAQPQKYIPPSLRALADPETETLTRLKRQAQGHLNKMSEANMISIVAEFEKLYRDYPRQNVTSTLINLLMGLICERAVLQDTFIVLHAGFIAAIYKLMGMDFGAEIVQRIVETLDAETDERGKFEGKEVVNLVSLLSQLYNFHVIGSPLMFDYIRLFLQDITETNTELLLKVIRSK